MTVALRLVAAFAGALSLGARQDEPAETPRVRPVRTVVVQNATDADPITLTGQIQARDQANMALRIDVRLAERSVSVGSRVTVGDVVARIQTDDAENALRTARANLSAAQATLTQAEADESRQKELLSKEIIAKARYEQAQKALRSAQAQAEAAESQVQSAEDTLSCTELRADSSGTITAVGADSGEVVRAGQMIVQVTPEGGKDPVFHVPAQVIRKAPRDPAVTIALADDPGITASTYVVKVGLTEPPEAMRLGAMVIGTASLSTDPVVRLPGTALTQIEGDVTMRVVDPADMTVSVRQVGVLRYDAEDVIIDDGLMSL
jgi:RND family efflux transporter MFP subunit